MSLSDFFKETAPGVTVWVVAGLGSGVVWLVRRVVTNEKALALLRQELKAQSEAIAAALQVREQLRIEDLRRLDEVNKALAEHRAESAKNNREVSRRLDHLIASREP